MGSVRQNASQQAAVRDVLSATLYLDLTSVVSESERWVEREKQLSLALAMNASLRNSRFFSLSCMICTHVGVVRRSYCERLRELSWRAADDNDTHVSRSHSVCRDCWKAFGV